jgi:lysophospholipase L1-like esterase
MVDMAQAHHIRVVIGSIPPASVFPWRMNFRPAATIKILNAWLQQFCHEHRLSYVDYYAVLADSEGGLRKEFGADAVHPNQAGYAAMHALALRAIQ